MTRFYIYENKGKNKHISRKPSDSKKAKIILDGNNLGSALSNYIKQKSQNNKMVDLSGLNFTISDDDKDNPLFNLNDLTSIKNVDFSNCNFSELNLSSKNFINTIFENSDLTKTNFRGSLFNNVNLKGTIQPETNFNSAKLYNFLATNVNGNKVDFRDTEFYRTSSKSLGGFHPDFNFHYIDDVTENSVWSFSTWKDDDQKKCNIAKEGMRCLKDSRFQNMCLNTLSKTLDPLEKFAFPVGKLGIMGESVYYVLNRHLSSLDWMKKTTDPTSLIKCFSDSINEHFWVKGTLSYTSLTTALATAFLAFSAMTIIQKLAKPYLKSASSTIISAIDSPFARSVGKMGNRCKNIFHSMNIFGDKSFMRDVIKHLKQYEALEINWGYKKYIAVDEMSQKKVIGLALNCNNTENIFLTSNNKKKENEASHMIIGADKSKTFIFMDKDNKISYVVKYDENNKHITHIGQRPAGLKNDYFLCLSSFVSSVNKKEQKINYILNQIDYNPSTHELKIGQMQDNTIKVKVVKKNSDVIDNQYGYAAIKIDMKNHGQMQLYRVRNNKSIHKPEEISTDTAMNTQCLKNMFNQPAQNAPPIPPPCNLNLSSIANPVAMKI